MCYVRLIKVGFLEICYVSRFKGEEGVVEFMEKGIEVGGKDDGKYIKFKNF